jgi:hypothetical protein
LSARTRKIAARVCGALIAGCGSGMAPISRMLCGFEI